MRQLIFLNGKKYDIAGQAGNAYCILGTVRSWLKQCNISNEEIEEWHKEATSDNYDHLLKVCTEVTGVEFVSREDYGEWLN